jgi:hypothetical protein
MPVDTAQIKDHGGLKKAMSHTYETTQEHQFVMRRDIQSYYASIRFDVLMRIVESYVTHPIF